ncbi:MAG: hypothetical protein IJY16_06760, partial [Clostridia bacterium]|nr:hypothetical protein [Clostridia bacterium]
NEAGEDNEKRPISPKQTKQHSVSFRNQLSFVTRPRGSNFDLSLCSHKLLWEVLVKLFQKLAGYGAEPHTGHFSFDSFSLCASGVKEKSG